MSDIEIARAAKKKPIQEIGARLDIPDEALLPYGRTKAKISADFIEGLNGRGNGKLILVTAINPTPAGEGKTTNSLAIAHNLTGMGKKVLLVEGDIRRRTLTQYFDDLPQRGLVSVLSGETPLDEAITHPDNFGCDMLVGEKTSANAADLFTSDRFRDLITDLRSQYDAVIIDTPPVLIVPDARIIAMQADAVLFTVKWDSTSRAQVLEGLRLFRQTDQKVTGLVLSQINPKGMRRYGYGGKYGAYSSYGSRYYSN